MTSSTLARPYPSSDEAPALSLAVSRPAPLADGSAPVAVRPGTETELALGVARADVVRLAFSARVPTPAAMARLVAEVTRWADDVGRGPAAPPTLLDVEVVLAPDAAGVRAARERLAYLDALAGLGWLPASTRVVATPGAVVAAALGLARSVGADGVVLLPLAARDAGTLELLVAAHDRATPPDATRTDLT